MAMIPALLLAMALQAPATPLEIPLRFVANEVRLEATINGHGPFQLILDTGMPTPGVLLFESERVQALGLEDTGQRVRVGGGGSEEQTTQALLVQGLALALGPLSIPKTGGIVMPKPEGFPPAVDGVIGAELFFHYVVRIDLDRQRLVLSEPAGWAPPEGACSVPLVRQGGMVFVDLRVAVGAGEPATARVVVDIGAAHALSLNRREDGTFAPPADAIDMPLGRGIQGVLQGQAGRVRRVELGSFAFDGVVVSFPGAAHQRPGGGDFHDGNLGAGILKRFNVTFDYAGERMLLEKSKRFAEPFDAEMAGLEFDWQPDSSLKVRTVLPRSPGAAADVREGDILLSIDGQPTSALAEDGVHKALLVDGAEIKLVLRRGSEQLEKKLRLKRLL
jgi:PDZ domain/Aspartyl protease